MSAHEHVRKLLDQLMGTGRDGQSTEDLAFTDPRVCRAFLTGLCPHDLFTNTKMDIGECSKIHSLALRADYEKAAASANYEFEIDYSTKVVNCSSSSRHLEVKLALEQLMYFIKDCDRKIQIAKRRLAETQTDLASNVKPPSLTKLEDEINEKLKTVESLGAEGRIEESMAVLSEIEIIKQDARKEEESWLSTLPASAMQQQRLRVCEVCAAYLGLYDNDQRLADHFGGKLHMGFIKVRQRLKELQEIVDKKNSPANKHHRHRFFEDDDTRGKTNDRKDHRNYYDRISELDRDGRRRRSRSRSKGSSELHRYRGSRDKHTSSHGMGKSRSRRERSRSRSYEKHRRY